MINVDVISSLLFSVNSKYLFKQVTGKICLNARKHGNFTSSKLKFLAAFFKVSQMKLQCSFLQSGVS